MSRRPPATTIRRPAGHCLLAPHARRFRRRTGFTTRFSTDMIGSGRFMRRMSRSGSVECSAMQDDRIPMTREGYDKLKAELDRLRGVEMTEITKRVATAREMGDLSENAEYHAAREDQ